MDRTDSREEDVPAEKGKANTKAFLEKEKVTRFLSGVVAAGLAALLIGLPSVRAQGNRATDHWVGTWATAVVSSEDGLPPLRRPLTPTGSRPAQAQLPIKALHDQTLRQVVHTSIGGSLLRVVFTNAFGTEPLTIGAAHIAIRAQGAGIVPNTGRRLLFGGRPSITIPVGAPIFSDPVDLTVAPFSDVAVDLYVQGDTAGSPLTQHGGALQASYLSEPGDHTGKAQLPVARTVSSWYFLARLEVVAPSSVSAIVAFGDSITDGTASTPDMNRRWPNELARRLAKSNSEMAVLNLGIGGNRLLTNRLGVNGLARFDRDVASQSGVTHVVVLEGINDIGLAFDDTSPTAAELIGAHQQLVARAHARGLKIFAGTLTPFAGAFYATPIGEAKRQELNAWIRTSGTYDGVVDFEQAVRDPHEPTRMLAAFDPGDHLHFNDAGYRRMADAIDLKLFKPNAGSR